MNTKSVRDGNLIRVYDHDDRLLYSMQADPNSPDPITVVVPPLTKGVRTSAWDLGAIAMLIGLLASVTVGILAFHIVQWVGAAIEAVVR